MSFRYSVVKLAVSDVLNIRIDPYKCNILSLLITTKVLANFRDTPNISTIGSFYSNLLTDQIKLHDSFLLICLIYT